MKETLPRWDLSNIYPALDTPEFESASGKFDQLVFALEGLFADRVDQTGPDTEFSLLGELVGQVIASFNAAYELGDTLEAYLYSILSTDSRDELANKRWSEFEQVSVRLEKLKKKKLAWLGLLSPVLEEIISANPLARAHAFMIRNAAHQSRYLMSDAEEDLAGDLFPTSHSAWSRLQMALTSQLTVDFEWDGELQKLPLTALINLHAHPDESVRKRAYQEELASLAGLADPLAYCLNGVKGTVSVLDRRRGRQDALHSAIDIARIDQPTLQAMLEAMQASFPAFRKYLKSKARLLGKDSLPWWDLYAPVGSMTKTYTYGEARSFILDNFAKFSPDLAAFAGQAFDQVWIDAEPRDGKRAGAFCIGFPAVQESRILCNFDGSLDQVSTIAHELGHAYHNYMRYRAGKTLLQQETPMTLAETASIMCETIVMQAVLQENSDPQVQLSVLDTMLINDTQVIVDIYSRYLFEKEVFERREKGELSSAELSEIMERAQKTTYGDGLDERHLHKYMWTWKPHYYRTDISFYNFPYAFGLLFGTGLYALYQERGASFIPEYQELLSITGEGRAAELAARFGIDITDRKFWQESLAVIKNRIERFSEVAAGPM